MQIIRDRSCSRYPCNNMIIDYTDLLPDECLALIFSLLTTTNDLNNTSLVSHRWLRLEAQTRTHLTLYARAGLKHFIPSIFTRFNSLSQLVLYEKESTSINDNDVILITSMCPNLTTLKLRECRQLTDSCMAVILKNCIKLKKFSCAGCRFSYIGMVALLGNPSQLEVLSVERLNYSSDVKVNSFKVFKLGSKILKRLKLRYCNRNLDTLLEMIQGDGDNCFVEAYLECVNVTDVGVSSLSKCRDLIALHIDRSRCTDVGLISVAENCKGLKKLYVRYCKIGDEGLTAVGKHSVNLEDLILNGVSASCVSLLVIATNCRKLISLEVNRCEPITKAEIISIADICVALRRLCIDDEVYTLSRMASMKAHEPSFFLNNS